MTSAFPNALDNLRANHQDYVEYVTAADINAIAAAVDAIQTVLQPVAQGTIPRDLTVTGKIYPTVDILPPNGNGAASTGFVFIPAVAGIPSGTPANRGSGVAPLVWNTSARTLHVYDGVANSWQTVSGGGGGGGSSALSGLTDVALVSQTDKQVLTWNAASSRWTNSPATPMTAAGDIIIGGASGAATRLAATTNGYVLTLVSGSPAWAAAPSSTGMTNPMTTAGDLITGGSAGAAGRLGIGSTNQVLTVVSGVPAWANAVSGFANPMTTTGDLIISTSGATASRLGVGSTNQVLTVVGGVPTWQTPASGFADPTTTKGDLIAHGTSTTRLGVGSNGQVLTADSTQTLGVKWATPAAAGMTNPMTTTGDLIYSADGSGTPARLGVGTTGYVLTSNGTGAAPSWQTPGAGSIVLHPSALQTISSASGVTAGSGSTPFQVLANTNQQSASDVTTLDPLLDIVNGSLQFQGAANPGQNAQPVRVTTRPGTGFPTLIWYPGPSATSPQMAFDWCPRTTLAGGLVDGSAGAGVCWTDLCQEVIVNSGGTFRSLRNSIWADGHASMGIATGGSPPSTTPTTGRQSGVTVFGGSFLIAAGAQSGTNTAPDPQQLNTLGYGFEYRGTGAQHSFQQVNSSGYCLVTAMIGDAITASSNKQISLWTSAAGGSYGNTYAQNKTGIQVQNDTNMVIWQLNTGSTAVIDLMIGTASAASDIKLRADKAGNVVLMGGGGSALATNATAGFLYPTAMAGAPTGTPTSYGGTVPMVYDTTNHKLWIYDSGWKGAVFS